MRSPLHMMAGSLALTIGNGVEAQPIVKVYNWADYIGATTLTDFESKTGINVNYDIFDSNDTLEAKLLAGHSGYDVVVPSNHFLEREIKAGAIQKLDRAQLSNWSNLDAGLLSILERNDPGNQYAVPYLWGTNGIGYNVDKIKKALGVDYIDSLSVLFEPQNMKKLNQCGVAFLDAPDAVFPAVLNYLGLNPYSADPQDYKKAEAKLLQIKPFVAYFHSSKYVSDLANGDICIAFGYSGDFVRAANTAKEAGNGIKIAYAVPKEGGTIWFDLLTIPVDAGHVKEAHAFINNLLDPSVIADISNTVSYANPNPASRQYLLPAIHNDPAIYPPQASIDKLIISTSRSPAIMRLITRSWSKVKSYKGAD